MANYDIIGNIAILKTEDMSKKEIAKQAKELMKKPSVKTVVEKAERFKGRLRTLKVRHLAGEKNLDSLYKENGCIFKFNIEKAYFSPRLSNERLEIAKKIKKKDRVLVMFSGVAPFPIVIQKIAKPAKITAVELGREANKYAKENLKLNNMQGRIDLIQGDVKKIIPKLKEKFSVIVMPRPNLKDIFLEQALAAGKKGTRIFYYGFSKEDEKEKMTDALEKEAKGRIKILKIKRAGDIAPYKHRYRIEIKII